jgi:DNA-directed RNA polymerase subunit L
LIPLHFTEEEIAKWDREDYKFVLKKELTSNQEIQDVTTEDFSIFDKDGKELPKSFVKRILPPNEITKDYILITKLRPENNEKKSVHIEAYATKGIAIDCACWGVVSTCVYFNTIDEEAADTALKKLLKNVPAEKKKSVTAEFNTLQKYRYFMKNEYNEPSSFTMTVESECAMSSKFIFHKAGQICIEKLNTVIEQFRNPKEKTIIIDNIGEIANYYAVTIKGYTHTIGNLLQSLILNKYIRDKKVLEYIGYSVPHPLENTFLIKIKFINDTSMNELREFMINAISEIVQDLESYMKEFEEFSS